MSPAQEHKLLQKLLAKRGSISIRMAETAILYRTTKFADKQLRR